MKKFAIALFAGALFAAGGMQAQAQPGPHQPQMTHPAPKPQPQVQSRPMHPAQAPQAIRQGRYPTPPKHWGKRPAHEWQRHVDRCRSKYRTYNPRTDRFTYRGKTMPCRL